MKRSPVAVEFYGVARIAVGTTGIGIETEFPVTLGELVRLVESGLPNDAAGQLMKDGKLAPGIIINLDGRRFETEMDTVISSVDSMIFMSIDVGG